MADVSGDTESVALVIQAQCEHIEGAIFVLDAGLAFSLGRVQANAEALLFAKATGNVCMSHRLTTAFRTHLQPG